MKVLIKPIIRLISYHSNFKKSNISLKASHKIILKKRLVLKERIKPEQTTIIYVTRQLTEKAILVKRKMTNLLTLT